MGRGGVLRRRDGIYFGGVFFLFSSLVYRFFYETWMSETRGTICSRNLDGVFEPGSSVTRLRGENFLTASAGHVWYFFGAGCGRRV